MPPHGSGSNFRRGNCFEWVRLISQHHFYESHLFRSLLCAHPWVSHLISLSQSTTVNKTDLIPKLTVQSRVEKIDFKKVTNKWPKFVTSAVKEKKSLRAITGEIACLGRPIGVPLSFQQLNQSGLTVKKSLLTRVMEKSRRPESWSWAWPCHQELGFSLLCYPQYESPA